MGSVAVQDNNATLEGLDTVFLASYDPQTHESYYACEHCDVKLDPKAKHTIEAVVDRLVIDEKIRTRLSDSIETALKWGEGSILVMHQEPSPVPTDKWISLHPKPPRLSGVFAGVIDADAFSRGDLIVGE